ncbi:hypothetical protein [Kineosporia sp. NBRC 101677]|uniref:hypothetical protein n=1 Tax=Kineosporia sp. NBRC 101677 TaxID=3032197 RepID=UPI002557810C|nr:hypothetical protein [Kineosporia sp. NBRC 101677]
MTFRVRPRQSRTAVAIALAALLVTGCSGEKGESAAPAPSAGAPSPAADRAQLEQAGEQAGAEGFGALLCESVQSAVQAGQATGDALSPVLNSILTGAERSSDSVKDADIDATMTAQCPKVRTDALATAEVDSLKDLVNR